MASIVSQLSAKEIANFEANGALEVNLEGSSFTLLPEHVEIKTQDMPGWLVASEGDTTVALDIQISPELRQEGIAREWVNRVQNLRKELQFDLTDKIGIEYTADSEIQDAVTAFSEYISAEVLANHINNTSTVPLFNNSTFHSPGSSDHETNSVKDKLIKLNKTKKKQTKRLKLLKKSTVQPPNKPLPPNPDINHNRRHTKF